MKIHNFFNNFIFVRFGENPYMFKTLRFKHLNVICENL